MLEILNIQDLYFPLKLPTHSVGALRYILDKHTVVSTASVVRVLGYRSGGPGSIPGTTRKKK
jgi:hypothetical protein